MTYRLPLLAFILFGSWSLAADPAKLELKKLEAGGLAVHRAGQEKPILVFNAPPDGRPYVHPILAPDGKGVLTEFSPGHHKHQTGIYVGILKVNGRDYFHNRDGNYYKRQEDVVAKSGAGANWTVKYDWLDKDKAPVLTEIQSWTLADHGSHYILDLDWSAKAVVDVTAEKYDYGGLFIRMPFTSKSGGEAMNSEGKKNGAAEGQRSKWVDIGMPIDGRGDWGHIAVLDHQDNPGHPIPWRVDGQLGVGPARGRLGEWKIPKGETARAKYRLVIYTGKTDSERVENQWKEFTK
jgi:hypothetical protein